MSTWASMSTLTAHQTLAYQNDRRPFPVDITFRFASVPGGILLTASPTIELGGLFKLGAPLFRLLLPTLVERIVSAIKKVLETDTFRPGKDREPS